MAKARLLDPSLAAVERLETEQGLGPNPGDGANQTTVLP